MTGSFLLECHQCQAKTLAVGEKMIRCSSCGHENSGAAGAAEWALEILAKGILIEIKKLVHECPNCKEVALVDRGDRVNLRPGPRYVCFSCGSHWPDKEMEYCPECSQLSLSCELEELIICRSAVGFYVCRSCYNKIFQ